jgi:hypothetical protein
MNRHKLALLCAITLHIGPVNADTVISETTDTLPGKGFGALGGFMAGATAGPVGALAGAGIGALGGALLQRVSGVSDHAYVVAADDGSRRVVRSPGRSWSPGDQVEVVDGRLVTGKALDATASAD